MKATNPFNTLEQSINNFFSGILIEDDGLADTSGEYIYLIHSKNKLVWFTSPLNRGPQQIIGINSFLRLNSKAFTRTGIINDNTLIKIKKFKYILKQSAACKLCSLKICNRTSIAFQTASNKLLLCIIRPGKVGQVIKVSTLKQNLLNDIMALKNISSKIIAPKPIRFNELYNGFSLSAQTLLRGLPANNSISDKTIALELIKLTSNGAQSTSILEQSEFLLASLKKKYLPENSRKCIETLLKKNKNKSRITTSRIHGDLRPANIMICSSRNDNKESIQLGLLDWEFSKPTGIVITDFLRWKLDFAYTKAKTFQELFSLADILEIKKILPKLDIPGSSLPLNELVRLHIAIHSIDRFHSFGTSKIPNTRLNNLENILNSKWPNSFD